MNKLFTYGCSYTYGNGCLPSDVYHKKYKKKPTDCIWNDIVSKEFNLELKNYGIGRNSNDKIIDSIIRTFDEVNENDVVIIQKTFSHRFDIENRKNKNELDYVNNPLTITPSNEIAFKEAGYDDEESEHIMYTLSYMDCDIIQKRFDNRFNFFKKLFKEKNVKSCIVWDVMEYIDYKKYERISEVTKGKIIDNHWSYSGHKNFANVIIDMIKNPPVEKININKRLI
jgi:hypothetical protein